MGRNSAKSVQNLKSWRTAMSGLRYQQKRKSVKVVKAEEAKENK